MKDKETEILRKYILGDLDENRREMLEDRLFADENLSLSADETEHDLIDEYLRNELESNEKQLFERNFLKTESQRKKVEIARTLQAEVSIANEDAVSEKRSFFETFFDSFRLPQLAFASLALLITAFGGWYLFSSQKPIELVKVIEPTPIQTPQIVVSPTVTPIAVISPTISPTPANSNLKPSPTPKVSPTPKPETTPEIKPTATPKAIEIKPVIASILLLPSVRGGGTSQTLSLKPNTKSVNLSLANDRNEDFDNLRVEIIDANSKQISTQSFANFNRKRKTFLLQIPADKLKPGEYQVVLKGSNDKKIFQDLNFFSFTVKK
jgi:cell division septation protein DedD